jgi:hypothetical protein
MHGTGIITSRKDEFKEFVLGVDDAQLRTIAPRSERVPVQVLDQDAYLPVTYD